ncbi:MAG: hypothetical protein E6G73_13650 [Alphaproteobacteria bacterium]|nr:MAG: hypothetical protein E6G73_13650 [Alphaproteobacteria bacterium]
MSDICSPESATASFTAVSAWTASGTSAVRETFEKPTPLTATLHRFSHIEFSFFQDWIAAVRPSRRAPASAVALLRMRSIVDATHKNFSS